MPYDKPASQAEPVPPGDMDPNQKPRPRKGLGPDPLDPNEHARQPATEPPTQKRQDDL